MEFLGDACLQLLASHFIYYGFPGHNEGHLTVSDMCYYVTAIMVMVTIADKISFGQQQVVSNSY